MKSCCGCGTGEFRKMRSSVDRFKTEMESNGTNSNPLKLPEEKENTDCHVTQQNGCTDSSLKNLNDRVNEEREEKTEGWGKQVDFLLSCIGYSVGLGAFWRFPYLCMRNGGGAFLIPYFTCLILCGMPLFFLELSIGQFSGLGPLSVWNVCPIFKGIGWGMLIMSGIVTIYYNLIITWVLYFLFNSFTSPLPWATCNNEWNTANCFDRFQTNLRANCTVTDVEGTSNCTHNQTSLVEENLLNATSLVKRMSPSEEFWQLQVLQLSPGIEHLGTIRWPLFLCLLLSWVIVFFCLFKGIKWSGKVVYVTATVPYLFLTLILIRGSTLPGAMDGILFYVKPEFSQLLNMKVWAEACLQIFYSLGPAWGGLIAMSRHNKFNQNCLRDSVVVSLVCCCSSFYAGFVCFSIIGYMAQAAGKTVSDVITSGPGLAFSAYPEAISQLPISPLWAVLFFFMLLFLGIDSQFGMLETCTSGLLDEFPKFFKNRTTLVIGFVCVLHFLIGIPLVTQGGMYIFQILDWYAAAFSSMVIAFLECIVLAYIYGADKLYEDIEKMLGKRPSIWWKICWYAITPLIMLALLIYSSIQMVPPTYGNYVYPKWSIAFGWTVAMCSMVPIPLYAVYIVSAQKGPLITRVKGLLKPTQLWSRWDTDLNQSTRM